MPHPVLAFCPYLPLNNVVEIATWRIGPVAAFEDRWADPAFKGRAEAFLTTVGPREGPIDGRLYTDEEIQALQAALDFGFLDANPRATDESRRNAWATVTADNTELFLWPIDVEQGYVTVTRGAMVTTHGGGFRIDDAELQIRSPVELHLPLGTSAADTERLEAIYNVCLGSLRTPGASKEADRLRTAVRWLAKAWRNTTSIGPEDRVVFLKTAFEALTGTSESWKSGSRLRKLFEGLKETSPDDAELLLWSPAEKATHQYTYTKNNAQQTGQRTDLEEWFAAFGEARNSIIHEGVVPALLYNQPGGSAYDGPFVTTAEFLLRAAIKASLASLGYPNIWRSALWRIIAASWEELQQAAGPAAEAAGNGQP